MTDAGCPYHLNFLDYTTPFYFSGIAILRACYRARKPQNPENTKKIQNPVPQVGPPKIRKKIPKKYTKKKAPKRQFLGSFCVFFRHFFPHFWGPTWGGGFCIFFVFSGFWGFRLCSRLAGSQFRELISVITSLPTTPNQFSGDSISVIPRKYHPALSLLGTITQPLHQLFSGN